MVTAQDEDQQWGFFDRVRSQRGTSRSKIRSLNDISVINTKSIDISMKLSIKNEIEEEIDEYSLVIDGNGAVVIISKVTNYISFWKKVDF